MQYAYSLVFAATAIVIGIVAKASDAQERVQETEVGSALQAFQHTLQTTMPADRVLVINLKRRPDRVQTFYNRFPYHARSMQVFEAVDGKFLKEELRDPFKRDVVRHFVKHIQFDTPVSVAELGCFLSHYAIWMLTSTMPAQSRVVVFEDDVNFSADFPDKWATLMQNWSTELQFIYLGGRFRPDFVVPDQFVEATRVPFVARMLQHGPITHRTTAAYVLTTEFAKELLKRTATRFKPVDHFLHEALQGRHDVGHTNPLFIWTPLNLQTDIQREGSKLTRQALHELLNLYE